MRLQGWPITVSDIEWSVKYSALLRLPNDFSVPEEEKKTSQLYSYSHAKEVCIETDPTGEKIKSTSVALRTRCHGNT